MAQYRVTLEVRCLLPEVRPLAYLLRETAPGTWIYVDAVKRIVTTSEPPRRRKVAGR